MTSKQRKHLSFSTPAYVEARSFWLDQGLATRREWMTPAGRVCELRGDDLAVVVAEQVESTSDRRDNRPRQDQRLIPVHTRDGQVFWLEAAATES